jgi:hypothetical protein
MKRYGVLVADCCGEFSRTDCKDFAHLLEVYREKRAKYPGKGYAVMAFNEDTADIDCPDGLTEDEREMIETATHERQIT